MKEKTFPTKTHTNRKHTTRTQFEWHMQSLRANAIFDEKIFRFPCFYCVCTQNTKHNRRHSYQRWRKTLFLLQFNYLRHLFMLYFVMDISMDVFFPVYACKRSVTQRIWIVYRAKKRLNLKWKTHFLSETVLRFADKLVIKTKIKRKHLKYGHKTLNSFECYLFW